MFIIVQGFLSPGIITQGYEIGTGVVPPVPPRPTPSNVWPDLMLSGHEGKATEHDKRFEREWKRKKKRQYEDEAIALAILMLKQFPMEKV